MNYEQRELVNRIVESSDRKVWVTFTRPSTTNRNDAYHFKVSVDASDDFDINEFHKWVLGLYINGKVVIENKTFEQLCDDLYIQISSFLQNKNIIIEVSGNGELGCTINYNLTRPYQSIVI